MPARTCFKVVQSLRSTWTLFRCNALHSWICIQLPSSIGLFCSHVGNGLSQTDWLSMLFPRSGLRQASSYCIILIIRSQTWHGQKRSWERKGQDNSTRFDAVKRKSSCTMLFLRVINSSQLLRCLWLVEICFCPIALATIMCLLWYSTFTLLPTCKFKNASNTVNGTFSDSCDLNHPSQSPSLDCPSTL